MSVDFVAVVVVLLMWLSLVSSFLIVAPVGVNFVWMVVSLVVRVV